MTYVYLMFTLLHLAMTLLLATFSVLSHKDGEINNAKLFAVGAAFLFIPTLLWACAFAARLQ